MPPPRPHNRRFRPVLAALEPREVPALFAVSLDTPGTGRVGEAGATYGGNLFQTATRVEAPHRVAAAASAVGGSLKVTLDYAPNKPSTSYAVSPSTVSVSKGATPWLASVAGDKVTFALEDLTTMPGRPSDNDYNDRYLDFTVREVASISVAPAPGSFASEAGADPLAVTAGRFRLTRSGDTSQALTVSVTFDTGPGLPTAGADFTAPTSVTFAAGEDFAYLDITPKKDNLVEGSETVRVRVSDGGSSYQGGATADLTLADDPPVVSVAASGSPAELRAAKGYFTFTKSGGDPAAAIAVAYTMAGTATSGSDYGTMPGTILISAALPGMATSSATADLTPINDKLVEGGETATAALLGGHGYNFGQSSATLTIADNDIYLAWTPSEADPISRFVVSLDEGKTAPEPTGQGTEALGKAGLVIDWGEKLGLPTDDGSEPNFFVEGQHTVTITSGQGADSVQTTFDVDIGGVALAEPPLGPPPAIKQDLFLKWEPEDNAVAYDVYRSESGEPSDYLLVGSVLAPEFTDAEVSPGSGYYYKVVPRYNDGTSGEPRTYTVALPPPANPAGGGETPALVTYTGVANATLDGDKPQVVINKVRAQAAQKPGVFVGVFDVNIDAQLQPLPGGGFARPVVGTGRDLVIANVQRYGVGGLLIAMTYDQALTFLRNEIAGIQRAPVTDLGNGEYRTKLQDNTTVTLRRDGEWGKYEIQRPGEVLVTIRIETRSVRSLLVRGTREHREKNNELDRIDRMQQIVEEKSAKGLENLSNVELNDWADKMFYKGIVAKINIILLPRLSTVKSPRTFPPDRPADVYHGPADHPTPNEVKSIKRFVIEIEGDWPELRAAVEVRIVGLSTLFAAHGYQFSAVYGATPFVP